MLFYLFRVDGLAEGTEPWNESTILPRVGDHMVEVKLHIQAGLSFGHKLLDLFSR